MGKLAPAIRKAKAEGWHRWIVNENDERAVLEGCRFVASRGERIIVFCRTYLRHYEGRWAGRPFNLLPWQRDSIIMPLFGWVRPDGTRRFREASIWVAKKNGKTTLTAALALIGVFGDGEPGAHVYSAASSREQAAMIYNKCRLMASGSPEINALLTYVDSKRFFEHKISNSHFRSLSAEASTAEGLDASMVIKDELHAWSTGPGRRLYSALKYAGISRQQPLSIEISTAGDDTESLAYERYQRACMVRDGTVEDWQLLPVIYEADADCDPGDESQWSKANPSLGKTIKLDDMRVDYSKALSAGASEMQDFRRYRLNHWVTSHSQWIQPAEWAACEHATDESELQKVPCCGAIDLAHVNDSTAVVLCFRLSDELYAFRARFFLPADVVDDKARRDGVPYRMWAEEGHYVLTEGNVTDFAYVKQQIRDWSDEYDVIEWAYDPWSAHQMGQELHDEGLPMIEFRQGYLTMSEPCKQFQRHVKAAGFEHFGNPVLKWMVNNAVTKTDPAGNIKLDKAMARKRIDGAVASVMAFGRALLASDCGGVFVLDDDE